MHRRRAEGECAARARRASDGRVRRTRVVAQLRGQRARLVGLVLPELSNPIFPAFAEVVADALSRRGVTPVLCTRTAAGVSEAAYVEMLLDQHVSGVIFFGGQYHEAAADHG